MTIDEVIMNVKEKAREYDQIAEMLELFKEYQRLEKPRKLMKLPCMVGSSIYGIAIDFEKEQRVITELKISEVIQNCNGWFFKTEMNIPAFTMNDFGERVFLTREEAEAKLEELRGNNGKSEK